MEKKRLRRGVFITFEGVEGCGKSTHSRLIYKYLKDMGYPCIYTKEPGGTKIGGMIRRILLSPKNTSLNDIAELFLFEANRSQIVSEVIRPALKQKEIVICDRFSDATVAYQGYGSGLNKKIIREMNNLATGGLKPNLTIILDIDAKKGLRRTTRGRRKDRMEKKPLSFHNRVREGHVAISKKYPDRIRLIATREKVEQTQGLIRREVINVIRRYKAAG